MHVAWPGPALGSDCTGMIGVAKFSSFPPRRFKELWAVGVLPVEAVEASSQHAHLLSLFRARSRSSTEVDKRRRWAALLRVHAVEDNDGLASQHLHQAAGSDLVRRDVHGAPDLRPCALEVALAHIHHSHWVAAAAAAGAVSQPRRERLR